LDPGPGRYHFVGVGGVGMSAIAHILAQGGSAVSGSDLQESSGTRRLAQNGVRVFIGHRAENVDGAHTVVVSSAVPDDNVEVVAARARGIKVVPRMDMLARIMAPPKKGLAIAGTHGKTTTTSMVALMLEKSGLDPTILVGGDLDAIGGNARLGAGEYVVAEVDESDGTFVRLEPFAALLTNVEDDHLDHYRSMANLVAAFERFLGRVDGRGARVLCADDVRLQRMAARSGGGATVTYAVDADADFRATDVELEPTGSRFILRRGGEPLGAVELKVPGLHNVSNATGALALACRLGLPFSAAAPALQVFKGVKRRFQTLGVAGEVWIVDDYGHHPTEIRATLHAACRAAAGRGVCVFQPHRYTRTRLLYRRFAAALGAADILVLAEVYSAGEKPLPGVSSELIAGEVEARGGARPPVFGARTDLVEHLASIVRPGDLVLTLGAGNVWMAGVELIERLRAAGGA